MILTVISRADQVFWRMTLIWVSDIIHVFLKVILGLWILEKSITEVKCCAHYIISENMTSAHFFLPCDSNFDQLVQVVLARFYHWTLFIYLFTFLHIPFFGRESPNPTHTQGARKIYMYYLELFHKKNLFLPPPLYIFI